MTNIKLISWNVNGIRAVIKKGFLDFVRQANPDVMCIQETKAHPSQVDLVLEAYPYHFWNSAEKKGYSGTAVFSKAEPLSESYGLGKKEYDNEGRVITLEFEKFYLVNIYTPNSKRELLRLPYRQQWDKDFRKHMQKLEKKKPVVVCGDLNVAHKEIDLRNPDSNHFNPGFTYEEREALTKHLAAGYLDSFRVFNKEPRQYTWWSYMFNARANNVGWRIDYFLVSKKLKSKLKDAFILSRVLGSDHCPIGIVLAK